MQVDVTLDFVGDAVNSRSSRVLRAALTTLDRLAVASMASVLERAKQPVPRVLVYQDKAPVRPFFEPAYVYGRRAP
jgi:hypothetical protein